MAMAACTHPASTPQSEPDAGDDGWGASEDGDGGDWGPTTTPSPWNYIAGADYGIRWDDNGEGPFRTDRGGGLHGGVDFLMPRGTPLYAPCDGKYLAGYDDNGYGNWTQIVCPVPDQISRNDIFFASILFGHLDSSAILGHGQVKKGQLIGMSGKSGNAAAAMINPHLHFEIVIHDTEQEALNELHLKGDETGTGRIAQFFIDLRETCLTPTGLASNRKIDLGNRVDPFVLLACLTSDKPSIRRPDFQDHWYKWSSEYQAKTFDVNVGQQFGP